MLKKEKKSGIKRIFSLILPCLIIIILLQLLPLDIVVKRKNQDNSEVRFVHNQEGLLNFHENEEYSSFLLPILPAYSKLNETSILGNQTRGEIYKLIISNPGITYSSITKETKRDNGVISHHLYVLEREGLVKSNKTGKYRRYYSTDVKCSKISELQENIMEQIKNNPGISQSQISQILGVSRQVVNYNLHNLVSTGYVQFERSGKICKCFPTL